MLIKVSRWEIRRATTGGICLTCCSTPPPPPLFFSVQLNGMNPECVFVEEFLENNYTALVSAKYKGWYLGFNRKGRPKKGSRTSQTQQEVHFMKRPRQGKVNPGEPFRFTTVTKRTRRARRLKPNPKTNWHQRESSMHCFQGNLSCLKQLKDYCY